MVLDKNLLEVQNRIDEMLFNRTVERANVEKQILLLTEKRNALALQSLGTFDALKSKQLHAEGLEFQFKIEDLMEQRNKKELDAVMKLQKIRENIGFEDLNSTEKIAVLNDKIIANNKRYDNDWGKFNNKDYQDPNFYWGQVIVDPLSDPDGAGKCKVFVRELELRFLVSRRWLSK